MSWDVRWDAEGNPHIVGPDDAARTASREIDAGWREISDNGTSEDLIQWVMAVGEKHGYPLDEDWVRDTFGDMHRWRNDDLAEDRRVTE